MLGPLHHGWRAWTAAALVLAEAADDEQLLLAAYKRREAALVAERAEDEDVFVRVNHALVAGLETPEAAAALRRAYALDRRASGAGVEGFIARWVPAEFDIASDFARILGEHAEAAAVS